VRNGDSALAIAVANAVGASEHLPKVWRPDADYFKAHGRGYLQRLVGQHLPSVARADAATMKKGGLVHLLAKAPAETWTPDKFIECQWLTDAQMKTAFAAASAGLLQPKAARPSQPKPGKKAGKAAAKNKAEAKPKPARKAAMAKKAKPAKTARKRK